MQKLLIILAFSLFSSCHFSTLKDYNKQIGSTRVIVKLLKPENLRINNSSFIEDVRLTKSDSVFLENEISNLLGEENICKDFCLNTLEVTISSDIRYSGLDSSGFSSTATFILYAKMSFGKNNAHEKPLISSFSASANYVTQKSQLFSETTIRETILENAQKNLAKQIYNEIVTNI